MKKLGLLILILVCFSGCATASKQAYLNQIQEIETAYSNKEISRAEYLKLKIDSENSYRQRKSTMASGILAGRNSSQFNKYY